jgi:antitoxin (DNA-binding transcriptional repressor) of toxin-antitoxin stability system
MRAVDLLELENRLTEYVRLAAAGERVLVKDRDRVVAELTAPRSDLAHTVADQVLADLVDQGLATPPRTPPAVPPRSRRHLKRAQILADLDRDRADR